MRAAWKASASVRSEPEVPVPRAAVEAVFAAM